MVAPRGRGVPGFGRGRMTGLRTGMAPRADGWVTVADRCRGAGRMAGSTGTATGDMRRTPDVPFLSLIHI